jgi:gas vesicle protein
MGQSTAEVRRDIERTRDDMTETIDAIADRTSPSRVVGRQRRRVAGRFRSMRDLVMGTADDVKTSAHDNVQSGVETTQQSAGQLAGTARKLPGQARDQVQTQTQGNPLAAGLIAFGGGLLAAYVIPSSRAERRAAGQVRDAAAPAIEELKETGREVAEDLQHTVGQAGDEVKQTASSAAQHIADDARSAVEDVRDQASSATERVGDQARNASDDIRQ